MIIGRELLLELKLYLCLYKYKIKVSGGAYKECTAPMKYPSNLCDDASFRNQELWEIEHVLNSTRRTRRILNANYQRDNLRKSCQTENI